MPTGGGRIQDPARVVERGQPHLALHKPFLTGLTAFPNQQGGLAREALDMKNFIVFSDHLIAEPAVAFNRPLIELSAHASTF